MVAVIDYEMGNPVSVLNALKIIGAQAVLTHDKSIIKKATHIILPGVGAFGQGMDNLRKFNLIEVLNESVMGGHVPFLGICLGMQLVAEVGHEFGRHAGLGWVQGEVVKLEVGSLRTPHVGWNDIHVVDASPMFRGVEDMNFYFVHSFHLILKDTSVISSRCTYGQEFVASIHTGTIFGVQFHPEKSQKSGLTVIRNFLSYA